MSLDTRCNIIDQITRVGLVVAVQNAIDTAREFTPEEERALLRVAHTSKLVARGSALLTMPNGTRCGCPLSQSGLWERYMDLSNVELDALGEPESSNHQRGLDACNRFYVSYDRATRPPTGGWTLLEVVDP